MPTSIEPSRRFRDGPQAKHVPRGQRGLGHGSIAVSMRAVLIYIMVTGTGYVGNRNCPNILVSHSLREIA
jgi:hypothetical protein